MRLRQARPWAVFLILVLFLSTAGSSRVFATDRSKLNKVPPYMAAHETDEPLVPRDPPAVRHDVYDLKVRLKELGLYDDGPDDVYDEGAVKAVLELQRIFWLEPTGVVEKSTWRALAHGVERPQTGDSGSPPQGVVSLEIDVETLQLSVYIDDELWKSYPVAAGKFSSLSPTGEWKVIEKGYEQGGAFGSRWIALDVPWGGYGIHGTNKPWSIGSYASLGCIRMYNEDVEEVYDLVEIGTRVVIHGPSVYVSLHRPIREGTSGPEVVMLQRGLRKSGFDSGPCDGRYWENTAASVKELKEVFGLGSGAGATLDVLTFLRLGDE